MNDESAARQAASSDDESDRWLDWPRCPQCGRRRQTGCPTCRLAGDDFPLAEYIPAAETLGTAGAGATATSDTPSGAAPVLLMCPACDEAFAPGFYRRCAECGFDFGEGLEVESPEYEPLNARVLVAILLVAGTGIALIAYFWWLFAES
jgi:hypothetical protein